MQTLLRTALWLLLGGWVGAWTFFALVVARLAFRVLPSAAVAGALVSPSLSILHNYGIAAGLAVSAIAFAMGRGKLLIGLPLLLAAVCIASEYGVTPAIVEASSGSFGPGANAEDAAAFARLHQLSMQLFGGVLVGAMVLVGLHARADANPSNA